MPTSCSISMRSNVELLLPVPLIKMFKYSNFDWPRTSDFIKLVFCHYSFTCFIMNFLLFDLAECELIILFVVNTNKRISS